MRTYKRDPDKRPAAVVLLTRGPLVLAITRKHRIADLQLPGGKWEPRDGQGLVNTAARELREETGYPGRGYGDRALNLFYKLRPLVEFVAHTGRPVSAFVADAGQAPKVFEPTAAGWPDWVHPGALLTRWCTYREECAEILRAASEGNEQLAAVLMLEHLKGTI